MELERDRQLREVSESLIKKGKNLLNISQKELNRELQLWLINEKRRKLREGKTEKEQIMDLFFK